MHLYIFLLSVKDTPPVNVYFCYQYVLRLAQMALGKNTFVNLHSSPINAGGQKCTQGTPHVKARISQKVKMLKWKIALNSICQACIWQTAVKHVLGKPDMENKPGKPGTAQVICFGSGKFVVWTYALFVANGYPAWVKLPILGKNTNFWYSYQIWVRLPCLGMVT